MFNGPIRRVHSAKPTTQTYFCFPRCSHRNHMVTGYSKGLHARFVKPRLHSTFLLSPRNKTNQVKKFASESTTCLTASAHQESATLLSTGTGENSLRCRVRVRGRESLHTLGPWPSVHVFHSFLMKLAMDSAQIFVSCR